MKPRNVFLLVVFAVLCSAFAYLVYYILIADDGPTKALTVTFLIPVFGILFGHLFFQEGISLSILFGVCIILTGTALVIFQGRKTA